MNASTTEKDRLTQAEAAYDRGQVHHNNRRYKEALAEFLTARKLDPDNDRYHFKVAASYHNTDQIEKSIEEYASLIARLERGPFKELLVQALAFKGGNLAMLKRFDEAEILIERALEMDSVSATGLAMKGELFLERGQVEEALEYIKTAHELDPANRIVLALRDRALARKM